MFFYTLILRIDKNVCGHNVLPAIQLDASSEDWTVEPSSVDVVYNINMIHISPWEATQVKFTLLIILFFQARLYFVPIRVS